MDDFEDEVWRWLNPGHSFVRGALFGACATLLLAALVLMTWQLV